MIDTEALRKKVIDLAIQGKLTEQLPSDGDAETLYAQILDQKLQLIKEGKIKKDKALPDIAADEIPFEVPKNWKWVRIGEISAIVSKGTTPRGGNVAYLDSGIGFLRVENLVGYDKIDKSSLKYIDEETHNGFLKRSILEVGDILISIAGTLGRTGLVREDDLPLNTNQAIAFIRLVNKSKVDGEYIAYILNALTVQKELGNRKVAMAIPNLSLEVISKAIIPLPPLEEQKRIVDVLRHSFVILDEIDSLQAKYSNDLAVLKSKIIDAGIQGKLTEQLPEDGDAEDLYAQILSQKSQLIKEGKIKKEKPLPDIVADEIPFEIPKNWKWVRFGTIITLQSGQDLNATDYNSENNGTPYITGASNYRGDGSLIINRWTTSPKAFANKGDILLSCKGTVGKLTILDEEEVHIARQIMGIRTYSVSILYIRYFVDCMIERIKSASKGLIPGIERNDILSLCCPLPPIAEQKRIVSNIEMILQQIQ